MFEGDKYITAGVKSKIPTRIQRRMWDMIEVARQETELDYLQIFELKRYEKLQTIVHRQEEPEFEKEYLMAADEIVREKVYIIDSGEYCTMLLAGEY